MRATEAEGKAKLGRDGKAKRGEMKVGERKELKKEIQMDLSIFK